jgi:thioredoxin 1
MAKIFTDANFDNEVIETSKQKPVLVDFFATWCGPCKMQAPIIDELANEMGDKAMVGKTDTEESPNVANKYGIMSIPNIMIFKDGKIVENFIGLQSKDTLESSLKKYL